MATTMDFYPKSLLERYGLSTLAFEQIQANGPSAAIGWIPDVQQFQERETAHAKRQNKARSDLPKGWPREIQGNLVWSGEDLESEQYIHTLSASHIQEIEHALSTIKRAKLDFEDVSKATFPLPTLGLILESARRDIHEGRGFVVVRGLNPSRYSMEENAIIYLGISSYIGGQRARQNMEGMKFMHITDVKAPGSTSETRRPIYSNKAQPFHADMVCDILALFHLDAAREGGETLLASAWTIYNQLAATRPDIIEILSRDDWAHDTFGWNPAYTRRPLLFHHDQKIIMNFSRRVLTGTPMTPRSEELPPMSEAQAEALDAVHFCALENSVKIRLQAGDMCFVNNLAVLHSRNAFEDDTQAKRYVLRLWLRDVEKAWKLAPELQLEWDRVYAPLTEVQDFYNVEAITDSSNLEKMIDPSASSRCG